MSILLRLITGAIALAIAAFSVFGFLASFEPGVALGWKVGYATVFTLSVAVCMLALKGRSSLGDRYDR